MGKRIQNMTSAGEIGKEYARVYDARDWDKVVFTHSDVDPQRKNKTPSELALYDLKKLDYEVAVHTVGAAVSDVRMFRHAKYLFCVAAGMIIGGYFGCNHAADKPAAPKTSQVPAKLTNQ